MSAKKKLKPDAVFTQIADYVTRYKVTREPVYKIAKYCLLDALACAFLALPTRECAKLMGPIATNTRVPNGARVPGTNYVLDPVKAAFDIGTAIRWLDYNDSWYAAEGGHPSESLGAILATADYVSRSAGNSRAMKVKDVLDALVKVYEVQGVLAIANSYINVGLDYVPMINVASAAVATHLMGGGRDEIINALSNAWLDGGGPRLFRVDAYMGWRKSWASGDATSRGVTHAWMATRGEGGYPTALSAPKWGFCDAILRGKPIVIARPLGSYVVENIMFKAYFPAQIHIQTAGECAEKLHPLVKDRIADIKTIHVRTHFRAFETAAKDGPLPNAATRDHCIQYVVALMLLNGKIEHEDYEDKAAADKRIDVLRAKTKVSVDDIYTKGFLDLNIRTNANAVRVEFKDGSSTDEIAIEYPIGHPRRRAEGWSELDHKFHHALEQTFKPKQRATILSACSDLKRFKAMPFTDFMGLFTKSH